ncbi:MAG TPA: endolytic transglycosylase MltG [Acidobacteriota bacterium]|nr:endolytic transglycosylase MltG [Acidobacteriota bacterium]
MKRPWRVAVAFLLAAATGFAALWIWFYSELETPYYSSTAGEVFVEIPRGASAGEIAGLLVRAGVIHRGLPFRAYIRYTGMGRHIQAGEYRFAEPASPKRIVQRLVQGDVFFYSVTIPEGLTARETVALLAKNGLGNASEMERALLKVRWIRDLDPAARNLEGYLFPETYRFRRKADSETVIRAMIDQFRAKLVKTLQRSPLPAGWNLSRIVILASMIEKEVKNPQERPLVASVLINRLEKRMPLACDATIIYAMKLAGTYEGRLGKADLRMDSPYNSYLHPDLPPGPICNPGADSLFAALHPARTEYYYYVSRNDGSHQFSKDYESHVRAVNLYQKPLAHKK